MTSSSGYERTKRALDLALAIPLLAISAPIQLGVAALVAARLGRPVLFRQQRPGLGGHPFTLLKFRTMLPVDERRGRTDDAARLTPFGRGLRSTSLDELPELWNVLRGDMSFVGPRPLLMEYLPRYSPEQARRHDVRPGMTGLAQVSGRNALGWDERLRLDVQYVDRRGPALDLLILTRTVRAVLRREGITAHGHATVLPFGGSSGSGS